MKILDFNNYFDVLNKTFEFEDISRLLASDWLNVNESTQECLLEWFNLDENNDFILNEEIDMDDDSLPMRSDKEAELEPDELEDELNNMTESELYEFISKLDETEINLFIDENNENELNGIIENIKKALAESNTIELTTEEVSKMKEKMKNVPALSKKVSMKAKKGKMKKIAMGAGALGAGTAAVALAKRKKKGINESADTDYAIVTLKTKIMNELSNIDENIINELPAEVKEVLENKSISITNIIND
jgi:hypothetical protein